MRTKPFEDRIVRALAWCREDADRRSISAASQKFDIPKSTLLRRSRGGKTAREAKEPQLLLTPGEEQGLADAVLGHADRGFPVRIRELKRCAFSILHTRNPNAKVLGRHWPDRFLARHPDIQVRWRQTMDRVRVKAADPESIQAFYELVHQIFSSRYIIDDTYIFL